MPLLSWGCGQQPKATRPPGCRWALLGLPQGSFSEGQFCFPAENRMEQTLFFLFKCRVSNLNLPPSRNRCSRSSRSCHCRTNTFSCFHVAILHKALGETGEVIPPRARAHRRVREMHIALPLRGRATVCPTGNGTHPVCRQSEDRE